MSKRASKLFSHSEFQSEHSLASELPYWDFLEGENPCVVLADGTLVHSFELKGVAIETWDAAQVNALTTQLRSSLSSLPDGADLQFVIEVNSDFSKTIDEHENLKGSNALISWVAESRISALRNHVKNNILQKQNIYLFLYHRVKQRKTFLSSFFAKPQNFASVRKEEYEKRAQELSQLSSIIEQNFSSLGLKLTTLSIDETQSLIYRVLNPTRACAIAKPQLSLVHREQEFSSEELKLEPALSVPSPREQVVFSDVIQGIDSFFMDGLYHRIISLKTLPELTHAAIISRLVNLPFHFMASVQVVVPEQSKELSSLHAKRRMAHSMSASHGGRATDLHSEAKLQATEELLREIIHTGQKIFYFQLGIILRAPTKDALDLQTEAVLTRLRQMNGTEGISETVAGFKVFKTLLPAGNTTTVRSKRVKTDNLADLIPIYQPWRGHGKPVCLFQDRNSGLVSYDPFGDTPNFNALVTGSSGAGKSFLNNCILLQYLTQNPIVSIIDIGGSYKKLCEFLGGQYIEISPNREGVFPNSINPFLLPKDAKEPSPQKIKFLISFLEIILTDTDQEKLPKLSKSLIEEAILEMYSKIFPARTPRLTDLREIFESSDSKELRDYAKMLYPWTGIRPYGRLLDSENSLDLNSDFVAFDLKGLSSYPDLQSALILIITDFILGKVESIPNRRKQIYMDECWELIKGPASHFMEYCVRTLRKSGSGITFITQGLEEIAQSPIGAAILNNTATKFVLIQKGDMELTSKILRLNEEEIRLIRGLKQVKGSFSEAFLIANDERGIIRIVPTPVEYWISTSDAADNQLLEAARNHLGNPPLAKVIRWLAVNHPYGSRGVTKIKDQQILKEAA